MKKILNKRNIIICLIILSISICLTTKYILSNLDNLDNNDTPIIIIENIIHNENIKEESTSVVEVDEENTNTKESNKKEEDTSSNKSNSNDSDIKNNTNSNIKNDNIKKEDTIKENKVVDKNDEFRKKLLSKYNVFVGYKDEIDGKYNNSYAKPTKLYDEEVIEKNLTIIEAALSKYPKSFFSEIKNKWKPVSIYLVDNINNYAAGLTDNNNSSTILILIVATHNTGTSILESTIHHEMMHVIDCYFTSTGIYTSYYLEQSMQEYNPSGFVYGEQSSQYVYGYDFPYYFVSNYSKSNYKEDRAEIFANLMFRYWAPEYLKTDNMINEKAKLITNQINQNFSSASSYNNRWDKFINR